MLEKNLENFFVFFFFGVVTFFFSSGETATGCASEMEGNHIADLRQSLETQE